MIRLSRKQMLHRRVKILQSPTSWVPVGVTGVVTDLPKSGGFGVRIAAKDVLYPASSHPHVTHEHETFFFPCHAVELVIPEEET